MPKPESKEWTVEDIDKFSSISKLERLRDAAIRRYEIIIKEADKHQADADSLQQQIDDLVDTLPVEAQESARRKSKKNKPWE